MINTVKGGHLRVEVVKYRRIMRLLTFTQEADIRLFKVDQSFSDIPNRTTGLITQMTKAESFEKRLNILHNGFEGEHRLDT